METLIGFEIEQILHREQIYSVLGSCNSIFYPHSSKETTITFDDGTQILKWNSKFFYKTKITESIEDLFEMLSDNIILTILFNLDIFKRL